MKIGNQNYCQLFKEQLFRCKLIKVELAVTIDVSQAIERINTCQLFRFTPNNSTQKSAIKLPNIPHVSTLKQITYFTS